VRDHGFKLIRKGDAYPLAILFVLLLPIILILKLMEEIWFGLAYVVGFIMMTADGHSIREAHEYMRDDIQSMRDGAKYGGM
jgi:hypothetical protein